VKIKCQAKHEKKGDKTGGWGACYTCGGYGFVYEKVVACVKCERKAWIRPGNYTIFEGKEFRSIDGLLIVHGKNGTYCNECFGKSQRKLAAMLERYK
jgi:hypothetical protein